MVATWKHRIAGGREIGILVTWINNFIEIAANTQDTILFPFQLYFCQMYKELRSQTFVFFPHICPPSEDTLYHPLSFIVLFA